MHVLNHTYEIVICNFCGRQAQWLPIDRIGYSWQCGGSAETHGYKYLSSDQVTVIEVVPKETHE